VRQAFVAMAAVLAGSAWLGCRSAPPPEELPNIVLIVVDTLRADKLGVYGNKRGLSPFLDELAGRGTLFLNAYAPSSWTCPSVASLFSSRYASQHGVNSFDARLAPEEITMAEVLAERGYVGGGFSANLRMLEVNGYAQGFKVWHAYMGSQTNDLKPRADVLRRESIGWIKPIAGDRARPKLLYLQYMEPHTPYQPIEPFRSTFIRGSEAVNEQAALTKLEKQQRLTPAEIERLESLYDGEVAAVDAEIRTLFDDLGKLGLLDNAVIIITADHGEEFGEHGKMLHGFTLFNTVMRIPLIIVAPGFPAGRVVEDNVSLVDVAPTVLELASLPAPPPFEGRSLVPMMRNPYSPQALWARMRWALNGHEVIGEIEPFAGPTDFRWHTQAIVGGPDKVLVNPKGAAVQFNLQADPREIEPTTVSDALLQRLKARRTELQAHARETTKGAPLDDATREKLRALGYQP
jgi:arylsulfatase A-like enzyme